MDTGEIAPVRIPIHVITFRCQVYLVTVDFNFFCYSDIYTLVRYLILLMWTFLKGGCERSVVSDFSFPYEMAGITLQIILLKTCFWSAFSVSCVEACLDLLA